MLLITIIFVSLTQRLFSFYVTQLQPDEQLLTFDILIDKNDDFNIGLCQIQDVGQEFAFFYGIWSRYNPLSSITQIGRIGMLDSQCFHLHSVLTKAEKNINFLYYDCLDEVNQLITKNIKFRDESGQDHLYTLNLNPNQYESNWYFFFIMTWPHLEKVKMFVMHEDKQIYYEEIKIKFPYFEKNLTLNIGGGADGYFFQEQIQFSYFPGSMNAQQPFYEQLDPETNTGWTYSIDNQCQLPSDLTILNYNQYENTDISFFSSKYPNKNYFLLGGWIKIVQIIQVDDDFTYKLLKMTTNTRNSILTNDNLSPFCLYYHISDKGNQIIFTTYSYSFPSVNVDFTQNPYLILERIDLNINVWQYLTVELNENKLFLQIIFYDQYHSTYEREIQVVQFQDIVYQIQLGNIQQRKDNYINFEVSQMKFSNCDSVVFFQDCHTSCLECDGPTRKDCFSCSENSNRQYLSESKQCNCPYNTIDKTQCVTHLDLQFNILKGDQDFTCPFGYFKDTYSECFQCPSIINDSQITCLECLYNPKEWINMLYCSQSLVSQNRATFKLITEDNLYFTFDGSGLNYCQSCYQNCLDEECIYNNIIQIPITKFCFSSSNTNCYACNIKNCKICGLSADQQFVCLVCTYSQVYYKGECSKFKSFPQKCVENCAHCYVKQCNFCFLPYYLNSNKSKCKTCTIPNCLYCFEFQINDRSISTLYKDYKPFEIDENIRIGCSKCVDGFNYDFQLEKCVQGLPKLKNCLRSYIEISGQEICTLSSINDFNVAPQIINCQQLISNCEQCLLTPSQVMQCIICEKGYSASITGQCHFCEFENAEYCLDGTIKRDYWVQLIQSFLIQFLPDRYMFGFKSTVSNYASVALSCRQGYRLSKLQNCVKDCDIDCLSCIEKSNEFFCEKCPINYYGFPSLSATQNTCLICPQLCLTCVERNVDSFAQINSMFISSVQNVKYSYKCLQTVPDSKVYIDPISLIATYCFADDCHSVFEYQVNNQEYYAFQVFDLVLDQVYYEKTIDVDYCNRMGIKTFQLTILLKTNNFKVTQIPIFLKQKIFSLQKTKLFFLGDVEPDTTISSPLTFLQFDFVKWQNITFTIEPSMTIIILNNGLSVDLTLLDSIFTGNTESQNFIQNANYKDLRIQNVTFKNLYLKDMNWLEYQTNNEQTTILIDQLTISNCIFENVTLFSILNTSGSIQINQINIIESQFVNSALFSFNQTSNSKGVTIINDFMINNCIMQSSNLIVQISAYSLEINNVQIFNSKFNYSVFLLTNNDAVLYQVKIDLTEFILSSFFQVIIETSTSMNFKFSIFSIQRTRFTDSRIIFIHSVNNLINVQLNQFQHISLNTTSISTEIIFLYDIKCSDFVINDITILNSYNLSFFNAYQTKSIQFTDIIYKNLNQEYKIQPIQECNPKIKFVSTLIRIQGFQQIYLKNLYISNQFSIDQSLIQIFQDLLFYQNDEGLIDIQQVNFFGNVLIKQSLGKIFSLLVIYSDFSSKISLKDLFFEENFFNQQIDDPSRSAASLIYVNTQLSTIKISSINCFSNGLTNSSYSFMMINSLNQFYSNLNVQNSNLLSEKIWIKYYQIKFDFLNNSSHIITKLIQQIFTISNIGGVFQIITSSVFVENATFSNIQAYSRSIFDITTQGQGIIILNNIQITNTSTALYQNNVAEGCITISSQNSNLYLQLTKILFKQTYNRLDSAILSIYPSKKLNYINLNDVEAIDCYSLINQFLFVQFSKESKSYLTIRKLLIKNTEPGLINYLQQILFPSSSEIRKLQSDNALLQVQNGNINFNDLLITGILISPILLLSDQENGKFIDLTIFNLQVLYPMNLIMFSQNINSTLIIQQVKINNVSLIQPTISQPQIRQNETTFFAQDIKNCYFSIQQSDSKIYSIYDLIVSLNTQKPFIGSLITIILNTQTKVKMNNIFLFQNACDFCYEGLILIQQNQAVQLVIQELKCYGNIIRKYGCLALKTVNKIEIFQNLFAIQNSAFLFNQGSTGVGIFTQNVLIEVKKSLFFQNKASDKGGALYMQDINNNFLIKKCLIYKNSAQIGGGLYLSGSNYLTSANFYQSFAQFNTADLYSNNLVEAPDHLILKINNLEVKSVGKNHQIISLSPYQLFKGKSYYTTALYLPSGQLIKSYMLFDKNSRIFVKYINQFSLIWKNSINEDLIGFDLDECQMFDTVNLEENADTPKSYPTGKVIFNTQANNFDLLELKVTHNPYINQISYITFQCTSATQTKSLFYQINAKTFNCQQGEFFSNNECKICDPIYGFYSVSINSTQCSIFDENKFQEITQNQIKLKGGFWRPKFTSKNVELCFKKQEYCTGGWGVGNNLCFPGQIGGLCEECDIYNIEGHGHYAQSGTNICNICSDQQYQFISPIFLMFWSFISLLLSLKSNRQTSKTFARLRATTTLYEILFKLSQDFENILLKMFLNYLWLFSVIFTFNIKFDFSFKTVDSISTPSASVATNLDCMLSQISNINLIYLRIVFMITFILIQILIVSGGIKIFSIITKFKFDLSLITNIFLYLFVTNQAAFIKSLSSLIAVRTISEQQFIQGNVSMLFYKEDHLDWVFSFILPGLLIIGVFIPLILFLILNCYQNQSNSVNFRKHFGYLFNDYNQKNQFWEQVRILVRTTIIVFLTSFETSIYLKACLISLTILIYQILAQNRKPYIVNNLNFLDIESVQIVLLSIFLALIKYVCEQNQNLIPSLILQIIIGILLIGLCLSFIVRIVQLYSKKHYLFVLNLMNQLCKNYCKIGIVNQFFQKKLNQKLIKKYQVQINYQKLAAIINMNKTKSKFCFQKTLSKIQERKQINLLTPNLLKR